MNMVTLKVPKELIPQIKHLTGQLIIRSLTAIEKMKFDIQSMIDEQPLENVDWKTVNEFQNNIRREQALVLKYQLFKESL